MATPSSTLYPTWPSAGSVAFLNQIVGLVNTRLAGCPKVRDTSYFIRQDAAGDASGGGGAGTIADPFLVETGDECFTLIESLLGTGNVAFFLNGGDVFGCSATASLLIDQDNVTIRAYGTGRPIITTFADDDDLPSSSSWTLASGGRYTKTFTGTPDLTWVRLVGDLADLPLRTEQAFTKCTTTANVEATDYSFYLAVSGSNTTVHVRTDGTAISDGDMQISRGSTSVGIEVSGDKCRVHQVILAGFGIQQGNNGLMNLVFSGAGTKECVFSEVGSYYSGGAHLIASLANSAGGMCTVKDCDMGLVYAPTVGDATNIVFYNASGDHEGISLNCIHHYGSLPEFGQRARRGVPYYSHTAGGAFRARLMLSWGTVVKNHTYGLVKLGNWGGLPDLAGGSQWITEDYRGWAIGDVNEGGTGTTINDDIQNQLRINCIENIRLRSTWNATSPLCDATQQRTGLRINCATTIDLQDTPNDVVQAYRMVTPTTYTINQITAHATNPVVQTTGAHGQSVGRYMHIYGTNTTPPIDGVYRIVAVSDSTHFEIEADTSGGAGTAGSTTLAEMTGEVYCHTYVDDNSSGNNHIWVYQPGNSPGMKAHNRRVFNSAMTILADNSSNAQNWFINQAPSISEDAVDTGGGSHVAYWSASTIQKTNSGSGTTLRYGYNSTTNYRDNTTSPALAAAPVPLADPPTGLFQQGTTTLPFAVEYDINLRTRSSSPSIGPVDDRAQPLAAVDAFVDEESSGGGSSGGVGTYRVWGRRRLLMGNR